MNILALLLLVVPVRAEMAVLRSAASMPAQSQSVVFDGSRGALAPEASSVVAASEGSPREALSLSSRFTPSLRGEVPAPDKSARKRRMNNGAGFIFDVAVGSILIAAGVVLTAGAVPVGAMIAGAGLKILGILSLAKAFNRLSND